MTNYEDIIANLSPEEYDKLVAETEQLMAGIKFVPNPGPQTDAYFSEADVLLYGGAAGCTSGDTEYLTSAGWQRIDSYDVNNPQSIAVLYLQDKHQPFLHFETPLAYIDAPCKELIEFKSSRISMALSECHKMPLYQYNGKLVVKTAAQVERKPSKNKVPTSFNVWDDDISPRDELFLRLAVAIKADGNLTHRKDGGAYCRISLRKQRKKDRLLGFLSELNIAYHTYNNPNRPTEVRYGFESPTLSKKYDEPYWYTLPARHLQVVLDEVSYWDGAYSGATGGDICYNTTNKCDADFIQFAAHACGRFASISVVPPHSANHKTIYRVHISKAGSVASSVSIRCDVTNITRIPAERMYCFTTTTGFWLARRDGKIFITGNSGKSGLILGLALSEHEKSLILRPSYTDLFALTEDAIRLNGTREGFTGGTRPRLRTKDKRTIEFGAIGDNSTTWQGQPHDLLAYDELANFKEHDFRFLQTWVRSVKKNQRTRVLGASNPPTSSAGDWIIGYWRPWLDPTYHKPAKHGELRWVVTDPDGKDMWVDGPEPILFSGEKTPTKPKSRTFIPGKLSDNPYLINTDYKSTLDALPEPLRSAMRDGNFMLSRTDKENQVIPTSWIRAANARWNERKNEQRKPMNSMGCDPSLGGDDTVLAPIRDDLFVDPLIAKGGKDIVDGSDVAALVVKHLRNGAWVGMDMGGGYGGDPKRILSDSGIKVLHYVGSKTSSAMDQNKVLHFDKVTAESLWRLREALDPEYNPTMALPEDQELMTELCAYTFEVERIGGKQCISITPKEKIKKEIGRSPGRADALRIAYWTYLKRQKEVTNKTLYGSGGRPSMNVGHSERKRHI